MFRVQQTSNRGFHTGFNSEFSTGLQTRLNTRDQQYFTHNLPKESLECWHILMKSMISVQHVKFWNSEMAQGAIYVKSNVHFNFF